MTSRAGSLRRIAKLYGVVEEMHAVALRQASAKVQEAEWAIRQERHTAAAAVMAGRTALTTGEREEWMLAHAEGEISAVRTIRFEAMKTAHGVVESAARTEFLESRVKTEQMKQVVTKMTERAALEEGRRTQAVSDDRYAARRAWVAARRDR